MTKEITLRIEESWYDQFVGFISLNKKLEIVEEKVCKKHPCRKGRPKRSGAPIVKAFRYDGREKSSRLVLLCQGLKALGWIDSHTDMQLFIDLFSGGEIRNRIVWKGPANILAELFRRLVKERQLVSLPPKHSLWVMVNGHFWDKEFRQEFGIDRLRMTHCPHKHDQTIAYMVDMLDSRITIEEIRKMIESQR